MIRFMFYVIVQNRKKPTMTRASTPISNDGLIEFAATGDYMGYEEDDVQPKFGGHHSHSSVTLASNDSSMDGVYVYRSDQDLQSTPCRFVKGHVFKRTVLAVVMLNTALLGARTYFVPNYTASSTSSYSYTDDTDDGSSSSSSQYDSSEVNSVVYDTMTAAAYIFLGFFTLEICLKIIHYQQRILRMGWTLVDVAVVVAAWAIGPSLTVFRLTRLKGIFKKLTYTQVLIKSLVRVLPQIGGILLILLSVFYAFAVILTSFCPIYFTSLGQTMWLLLNLFFLHQWDELSTDVSTQYPHAWILLLIFTILTTGMLASLVIAVMTNAVAQTHREQLDKSLDSDGVSTKNRRVTSPTIVRTMSPLDDVTRMMNTSFAQEPSETAMLLQYCQRLESKLDELTRHLERSTTAEPSSSRPLKANESDASLQQQHATPLLAAARAKRESFRAI